METITPAPRKAECMLTSASHHSKDRLAVYHGRTEPATGCGFHTTYFLPELIAAHNTNGVTA